MFVVFLSQNANCEYSQQCTCRVWFFGFFFFPPLRVAITVMMMLMISISIAIGSIDLNDQCPEGDYFSKEKLNRNVETVLGRHRKATVHSVSSRH